MITLSTVEAKVFGDLQQNCRNFCTNSGWNVSAGRIRISPIDVPELNTFRMKM